MRYDHLLRNFATRSCDNLKLLDEKTEEEVTAKMGVLISLVILIQSDCDDAKAMRKDHRPAYDKLNGNVHTWLKVDKKSKPSAPLRRLRNALTHFLVKTNQGSEEAKDIVRFDLEDGEQPHKGKRCSHCGAEQASTSAVFKANWWAHIRKDDLDKGILQLRAFLETCARRKSSRA